MDRLQWAAYDLLLHKQNWGTKDVARRSGLPILAGPNDNGSVTLFDPSASLKLEFMDPFGVYATDRGAQVNAGGPGVLVNEPAAAPEPT